MMEKMSIEGKRKAIQEYCEKNDCGLVSGEVFEKGYPPETIWIYCRLAVHHNGKLTADELFKAKQRVTDLEEMKEEMANAIWNLYKDGLIEICTLTNKDIDDVYEEYIDWGEAIPCGE